MWVPAMGQVGNLSVLQMSFSTTLHIPPGNTAHDISLIYSTYYDLDGFFTISHDCLIVFPDTVSPTLVILYTECPGPLPQTQI